MNIANKITIVRILLIPFFIAFPLYGNWEAALVIFIIAAVSDGIDGYIARTTKQRTELGKILDPIADKFLILSAFICLSVVKGVPPELKLPPYVPIAIISRDAIIILGALLIFLIKGNLEIKPTPAGKITTFFQMLTVIAVLAKFAFSPILWNVTVALTILSGAQYVVKGNRILNEK
ncbi:MAG: CDP-alcohol phosphatidyltransferase family protein [Candidatus Omnitrophota bacterium]